MSSDAPKVAKLKLKSTTVNTGFGSGSYNPKTGEVGYTLDPTLQGFRDTFYDAAGTFTPSQQDIDYARGLTSSGQSILNRGLGLDINQVTQDYYNQQTNMMAPSRAQEESRLADTLFKTGRTGAAVGRGEGYLNPEQFALLKAREEADAMRFMGAEDRARALQGQDIQRGLGLMDSGNALAMRPYSNMSSLFNLGAGIEGLGMGTLNTVGAFAPLQMNWQQAIQQNQQAINDAKAAEGSFGDTLLNTAVNAGMGYITGGPTGAVMGALGSLGGRGGGMPMGGGGQPGYFGGTFGNLFSGFNGTSPSSSMFGNGGFGNLVDPWNSSYSPQNLGIGMGGYQSPINYGGGTLGPSFY